MMHPTSSCVIMSSTLTACATSAASVSSHSRKRSLRRTIALTLALATGHSFAAERAADRMLRQYFQDETAQLGAQAFANVRTLEDWSSKRDRYREELFEMAGLSPRPEKSDLEATITGRVDRDEFYVEKLQVK